MHETALEILRKKREDVMQEIETESLESSPAKDIISVLCGSYSSTHPAKP